MKKRMSIFNLIKENSSKILLVARASALENEIRFYLNQSQYVTAVDCKNGFCEIKLGESENKEETKVTLKLLLQEFKKESIIFLFLLIIFVFFTFSLFFILYKFIKNIFFLLLFFNTIFFIFYIIVMFLIKITDNSVSLKSKHSAEHMMVNFIENNNRLPRNMEEIKSSSRFSINCGNMSLVPEYSIQKLFALVVAFIAEILISCISEQEIINFIVFIVSYIFSIILIDKFEKVNFLIIYIQTICSFFVQLGSTTKNVKDEDIMLAFFVARKWIKIIYPEFYNEEEDTFEDEYFEVNTN